MCHGCSLTDLKCPQSAEHADTKCWEMTLLMVEGGDVLTGSNDNMERSAGRIKVKLPFDGASEYSGSPPTTFEECSNVQKRLVFYHKLSDFNMVLGIRVFELCYLHVVFFLFKTLFAILKKLLPSRRDSSKPHSKIDY